MRRLFLVTVLLASGCSAFSKMGGWISDVTKQSHSPAATCPHPRPGWRTFDAAGRFCFNLPADMEVQTAGGIDSYVRVFKGPSMSLTFDFGPYSLDLGGASPDRQSFRVVLDTIDGVPVSITSWEQRTSTLDNLPYKIGLNTQWLGPSLGMSVGCASLEGYTTAREVFRSIRFQKDPRKNGWHKDGWVN